MRERVALMERFMGDHALGFGPATCLAGQDLERRERELAALRRGRVMAG